MSCELFQEIYAPTMKCRVRESRSIETKKSQLRQVLLRFIRSIATNRYQTEHSASTECSGCEPEICSADKSGSVPTWTRAPMQYVSVRRQSAADISDALGVTGLKLASSKNNFGGAAHARNRRAIPSADACPRRRKRPCETSSRSPGPAHEALERRIAGPSTEVPSSGQMVHCRDRRAYGGYRGGFRLHPADQVASLAGNRGASRLSASNLPSPKQAKAHATDVKSTHDQNGMITTR